MLHLDGSPHAWLARCPTERQTLLQSVDDATKRVLYAQLVPAAESTATLMVALWHILEMHGLPQALYTDRAGWDFYTPKAGEPVDRHRLTQVGRALARLGIEHIPAYSPQARGRRLAAPAATSPSRALAPAAPLSLPPCPRRDRRS